jgi:gas vesicle protein
VTDRQRAVLAAAIGATIGAVAGFMLFTERGREMRRRLEPTIENFARELVQMRGTVNRALGVAEQGVRVLNDALSERGSSGPYGTPAQTKPF